MLWIEFKTMLRLCIFHEPVSILEENQSEQRLWYLTSLHKLNLIQPIFLNHYILNNYKSSSCASTHILRNWKLLIQGWDMKCQSRHPHTLFQRNIWKNATKNHHFRMSKSIYSSSWSIVESHSWLSCWIS